MNRVYRGARPRLTGADVCRFWVGMAVGLMFGKRVDASDGAQGKQEDESLDKLFTSTHGRLPAAQVVVPTEGILC